MAAGAATLYTTGTPEQISAAVKAATPPPGGGGFMSFFDDVFSAVGDAVHTVGNIAQVGARVVNSIPGLNLTPIGSVISDAGALAGGGVQGLAGNLIGRAQTIAPVAASILGVPQLGGIASSVLGRIGGVINPQPAPFTFTPAGGGGGSGGGGASRTIGVSDMNPALLNQGPNALPTTTQLFIPGRSLASLGLPLPQVGGLPTTTNGCPMSVGAFRSSLLRQASANAGFRITWKKLLYLLLHFGIEVVKRLTQLDESSILWLYTTRPHRGRRGPHLRTIAKRARQVQGYRHAIARIVRVLGGVRHSRAPARLTKGRRAARR
jgi:hypothetical protein